MMTRIGLTAMGMALLASRCVSGGRLYRLGGCARLNGYGGLPL